MRYGVIYKATCILNGKEYVGKTIEKNPYKRMDMRLLKNINSLHCFNNRYLISGSKLNPSKMY